MNVKRSRAKCATSDRISDSTFGLFNASLIPCDIELKCCGNEEVEPSVRQLVAAHVELRRRFDEVITIESSSASRFK
jgi:hypothetical protein